MKKAIVVDSGDIKKILAEKFNVPEENVIKSQYSFSIIIEDEQKEEADEK